MDIRHFDMSTQVTSPTRLNKQQQKLARNAILNLLQDATSQAQKIRAGLLTHRLAEIKQASETHQSTPTPAPKLTPHELAEPFSPFDQDTQLSGRLGEWDSASASQGERQASPKAEDGADGLVPAWKDAGGGRSLLNDLAVVHDSPNPHGVSGLTSVVDGMMYGQTPERYRDTAVSSFHPSYSIQDARSGTATHGGDELHGEFASSIARGPSAASRQMKEKAGAESSVLMGSALATAEAKKPVGSCEATDAHQQAAAPKGAIKQAPYTRRPGTEKPARDSKTAVCSSAAVLKAADSRGTSTADMLKGPAVVTKLDVLARLQQANKVFNDNHRRTNSKGSSMHSSCTEPLDMPKELAAGHDNGKAGPVKPSLIYQQLIRKQQHLKAPNPAVKQHRNSQSSSNMPDDAALGQSYGGNSTGAASLPGCKQVDDLLPGAAPQVTHSPRRISDLLPMPPAPGFLFASMGSAEAALPGTATAASGWASAQHQPTNALSTLSKDTEAAGYVIVSRREATDGPVPPPVISTTISLASLMPPSGACNHPQSWLARNHNYSYDNSDVRLFGSVDGNVSLDMSRAGAGCGDGVGEALQGSVCVSLNSSPERIRDMTQSTLGRPRYDQSVASAGGAQPAVEQKPAVRASVAQGGRAGRTAAAAAASNGYAARASMAIDAKARSSRAAGDRAARASQADAARDMSGILKTPRDGKKQGSAASPSTAPSPWVHHELDTKAGRWNSIALAPGAQQRKPVRPQDATAMSATSAVQHISAYGTAANAAAMDKSGVFGAGVQSPGRGKASLAGSKVMSPGSLASTRRSAAPATASQQLASNSPRKLASHVAAPEDMPLSEMTAIVKKSQQPRPQPISDYIGMSPDEILRRTLRRDGPPQRATPLKSRSSTLGLPAHLMGSRSPGSPNSLPRSSTASPRTPRSSSRLGEASRNSCSPATSPLGKQAMLSPGAQVAPMRQSTLKSQQRNSPLGSTTAAVARALGSASREKEPALPGKQVEAGPNDIYSLVKEILEAHGSEVSFDHTSKELLATARDLASTFGGLEPPCPQQEATNRSSDMASLNGTSMLPAPLVSPGRSNALRPQPTSASGTPRGNAAGGSGVPEGRNGGRTPIRISPRGHGAGVAGAAGRRGHTSESGSPKSKAGTPRHRRGDSYNANRYAAMAAAAAAAGIKAGTSGVGEAGPGAPARTGPGITLNTAVHHAIDDGDVVLGMSFLSGRTTPLASPSEIQEGGLAEAATVMACSQPQQAGLVAIGDQAGPVLQASEVQQPDQPALQGNDDPAGSQRVLVKDTPTGRDLVAQLPPEITVAQVMGMMERGLPGGLAATTGDCAVSCSCLGGGVGGRSQPLLCFETSSRGLEMVVKQGKVQAGKERQVISGLVCSPEPWHVDCMMEVQCLEGGSVALRMQTHQAYAAAVLGVNAALQLSNTAAVTTGAAVEPSTLLQDTVWLNQA